VSLLALGMVLAVRVPAAMSADARELGTWSMQLHGGMFALKDGSGASPMLGVRYCKHYTPQLYGGLLSGCTWKRTSLDQPTQDPANPGPRVELAQVDARLIPLMGFVQVRLPEKVRLSPVLGVGAGYEWLALDVLDHRTGVEYKTTYGNMAWEAFGGLALRLNGIWRLNGEVFYNGGALQRKVLDANGRAWFEAVHVNGVGVRVGPDMDFW
jgi:hypothetical protein